MRGILVIMTTQKKPFKLRPFSLGYVIYAILFTFIMLLLYLSMTASFPPEYSGLRLQYIIGMLFLIGHTKMFAQVYMWAQETDERANGYM